MTSVAGCGILAPMGSGKELPNLSGRTHGRVATYVAGCRGAVGCQACRDAWAARWRRQQAAKRAEREERRPGGGASLDASSLISRQKNEGS